MTDSEDKGGTPSTLEKAVEKAVVHKTADRTENPFDTNNLSRFPVMVRP